MLFDPINLGGIRIKNRIVMAPMTSHFAENGFVTEKMLRYYEVRAAGGVGIVTVEDAIVDYPIGNNTANPLSIDDDRYIPSLGKLSSAIQRHGAAAVIQLSHAGRRAGRVSPDTGCLSMTGGRLPVAPSAIAHPSPWHIVPRPLRHEEVEEIIEKFARAAKRAVEAGFDMIGLHCAHMYLCGQFLSPLANKRNDLFGGSLDNRMRFVLEIIRRIRERVGKGVPIICRMNGKESKGGNSLVVLREIARRLEDAGVAALHVSVGFGSVLWDKNFIPAEAPMGAREGCIVSLAMNIKKAVSIPVITVNKIRHVDFAERVLREKKADMISLGRPLLADPEWPNKAMRESAGEIRPCVSCCQGCVGNIEKGKPITCLVNPLVGVEERCISTADSKKKVLVIGGGPAGLEAAITAAARGHQVTLWEREARLGGKLLAAAMPKRKREFNELLDHMRAELQRLGVNIVINKSADKSSVVTFKPDVTVLATGSVCSGHTPWDGCDINTVKAIDVFRNITGKCQKVIVLGGGLVGIETAEYLAENGNKVMIVEIRKEVASEMPLLVRIPLLMKLDDMGVRIITGARIVWLQGKLWLEKDEGKISVECDYVVLATGEKSSTELYDELISAGLECHLVGDCWVPGDMLKAIHDGFAVGSRV